MPGGYVLPSEEVRQDGILSYHVGFWVGDYDPSWPLVIDPALLYASYLGGNANEAGASIAVSSSGAFYVTGPTFSTDFPTTKAFQPNHGGGATSMPL